MSDLIYNSEESDSNNKSGFFNNIFSRRPSSAETTDNKPVLSPTMKFDFQEKYTFEKRKKESFRIKTRYPDRIPIICEIIESHKGEIKLDKTKYLVPSDLTVGQFLYIIRKRIKLSADKAVFLFSEDNTLPATSSLMSALFKEKANKDGFMYFMISNESTFG